MKASHTLERGISMIPYLQIELLNEGVTTPVIIPAGGAVGFDHPLNVSSAIEYDDQTAQFKIKAAGAWLVNWFTAQQTGLSPEGSNFGITVIRPLTDAQDPDYPGTVTEDAIVGSGHVKISPVSGFAIINVTFEEVLEGGVIFELQNVSSHDATLSGRTQVKAGLAIFGATANMFDMAYGQWQASGWDKNANPYNLANAEAIKFNQQLLTPIGVVPSDSGVGTRSGFDVFTLTTPGIYQISWEIPIEATDQVGEVEVALQLDGATVYSRSYSPLPIGIITGTAILATTTANKKLSLVNLQPVGGDIIQIGNYANLVIHQIS